MFGCLVSLGFTGCYVCLGFFIDIGVAGVLVALWVGSVWLFVVWRLGWFLG